MTNPTTPEMFYWVVLSGSLTSGRQGPYPKEIAEKKRDAERAKNPARACSIEIAWEAPFEKMLPVKIHENRYGAKADHLAFIYKADAKWFYVYVNTRVGKKYHRGGRDAGSEVFDSMRGGHSHSFAKGEVARIEALLGEGQPFDSGLRIGSPD